MHGILADGRWHPYETVVQEMARTIHAGRATRHTEKNRQRSSGSPHRRRPMSLENQVLSGQRHYAVDTLRHHIKDGRVQERTGEDGRRYVRLPSGSRHRQVTGRGAGMGAEMGAVVSEDEGFGDPPWWPALADIEVERCRQDERFPSQHLPAGTGGVFAALRLDQAQDDVQAAIEVDRLTWRHVLKAEFAEAMAETDPALLRAELVQVGAVVTRWIEDIDRTGERRR